MRYTIPAFPFITLLAIAAVFTGCSSRVVVGRSARSHDAPEIVQPAAAGSVEQEQAPMKSEPAPPKSEPVSGLKADEATADAEPEIDEAVQEPVELPPSVPEETIEAPVAVPRSSSRKRVEGAQDSPYVLDLSIGGSGMSEGYLDKPMAVAVDEDENIYVLDQGNQRIQCFDQYGEISFMWGSLGGGSAEYAVSDVDGVQTLRMTGEFELNYPTDMILDPDDRWDLNRITVTDSINHRIQRFLVTKDEFDTFPEDVFVMLPKSGSTAYPDTELMERYEALGTRVILDPVFLNDQKADPFVPIQYVWGGLGFTEDSFNRPTGLVMGADNLLYVADTENRRVQILYVTPTSTVSDTEYYFQIGNDMSYPYGEGRLNEPTVVAFDNTDYGSVLVLDKDPDGNFIIQRFSTEGDFMGLFTITGAPATMPRYPVDIALNPFDNSVFITDKGHRSVMVYNSKGEFMFSIGGEELKDPQGIAVLRNGYVYVTDATNDMVYRYIPR